MLNFSSNKSIGLDIADRSMEIAEINKSAGKPKLCNFGRMNLEEGMVEKGKIKNSQALSAALQKLAKKSKINLSEAESFNFALPGVQVYAHSFFVSADTIADNDLEDTIESELKKNIPLKFAEIIYSYKILFDDKTGVQILSVAAKNKVLKMWSDFFTENNIKLHYFDIEALASFRNLDAKNLPVLVADLGAATSSFSVFSKRGLLYNSQIYAGGDNLTRVISKFKKINWSEAEEIKKQKGLGLLPDDLQKELISELEPIKAELKSTIDYFETKYKEDIQEVIFIGGSSRLKGLIRHFQGGLNIPIQRGDSKYFTDKISTRYIEAVGLGLFPFEKKWAKTDPRLESPLMEKMITDQTRSITEEIQPTKPLADIDIDDEEANEHEIYKSRIKTFIIIIIIGLIAISGAYFFRNYEKNKKSETLKKQLQEDIEYTEPFMLPMPDEPIEINANNLDVILASSTNQADAGSKEPNEAKKNEFILPVEPEAELVISEIKKVIIKDTETGWLNVRNGPGVNFQIIAKIYPQAEYEYAEESNNWIKIHLADDSFGWILSKYAEIFSVDE